MKLHVVSVGKLKDAGSRALAADYAQRIGRYAPLREVEIKDAGEAEVAARFQKALPGRGRVVALEVEGRAYSSQDLADYFERCNQGAVSDLSFVIGGAYGLPHALSKAADLQLSLSRMTLPHRLARVLLLEQIYRAFTILRGEPYSH